MKILAIGDVCGKPGVAELRKRLPLLKREYRADFVIVNGENAAGTGIEPSQTDEIYNAGANVITLGNHAWGRREIAATADNDRFLLRPENFGPQAPGRGWGIYPTSLGDVCVISLIGRWMLDNNADNPFLTADRVIRQLPDHVKFIVVDFHAEATSEKIALGNYLDGRVSGVFGTHTHVQTADERILPKGTGFICDAGMTGPIDSVLGIKKEQSIAKFLGAVPTRYECPQGECMVNGIFFEFSDDGRCAGIERINIR